VGLEGTFLLVSITHRTSNILTRTADRYHRIHLRRHPSCRHTCYRIDLRHRQLQARCWLYLCCYYREQERVGLRFQQVHHAVVSQEWFRASHHAEHVTHLPMVFVWHCVLLLRQEIPEVEQKLQRA
jgi:hypothetical protein